MEKNDTITIKNDTIKNDTIKNDTIKNDTIKNDAIKKKTNVHKLNNRISKTKKKYRKMKEDIIEKYRKYVAEKDPNFLYLIINIIHFGLMLIYFIYPLFLKGDKDIDLILIYLAIFIVFHRTLIRGECILFLLEKWKIDKNYKAGQNKYGPGWHYIGKVINYDFYNQDDICKKSYHIKTLIISIIIFSYLVLRSIDSRQNQISLILTFTFFGLINLFYMIKSC
jgi:hypothetical protein